MIIEVDDKIISSDMFDEFFACDYQTCQGMCCVCGDSGAPLNDDEKIYIENNLEKIKPYLKPKGIEVIEKKGVAQTDADGDLVTTLINSSEECAYSIYDENGNCLCGIEKAFIDKKIEMQKPISCHLYPIRLKKIGKSTALNYDRWSICQCAREKGKNEKIEVFRFLKEPIIRKFGQEFYEKLEEANKLFKKHHIK